MRIECGVMKHLQWKNPLLVVYVFNVFKFSWEILFFESEDTTKLLETSSLQVIKCKLTTIL